MEIYKPALVVVVPFPFTDLNKSKSRPAVVLSSEKHQKEVGHVALLMITSAKHSNWSDDYIMTDLESAGLPIASIVRQKIFTIDSRLIKHSIGILSKKDQVGVSKKLAQHVMGFLKV